MKNQFNYSDEDRENMEAEGMNASTFGILVLIGMCSIVALSALVTYVIIHVF